MDTDPQHGRTTIAVIAQAKAQSLTAALIGAATMRPDARFYRPDAGSSRLVASLPRPDSFIAVERDGPTRFVAIGTWIAAHGATALVEYRVHPSGSIERMVVRSQLTPDLSKDADDLRLFGATICRVIGESSMQLGYRPSDEARLI
jgi:hypothetical protein